MYELNQGCMTLLSAVRQRRRVQSHALQANSHVDHEERVEWFPISMDASGVFL